MNAPAPPIGIDLGTTFSVVAYLDKTGHPQTIKNSEGGLTTPSVVFFDDDAVVVGEEACKLEDDQPQHVARLAKRDMGKREYHKPIKGEVFPPEAIQAHVLRKLKQDAEAVVGEVEEVVITVPAYFNEPRRKATQDAGWLAGLRVRDILNEPTAAAIAYGVQKGFLNSSGAAEHAERVLIYDLGGGTFDATLMDIKGNDYTVVATDGEVKLGGADWDERLMELIADTFAQQHGLDPREDEEARQKLLSRAEDAKRALTARTTTEVRYEYQGKRMKMPVTRDQFRDLTADLLERTRFTVKRLLETAHTSWNDVTRLLLVGGSTRMPMVAEMLEREFQRKVDRSLSADEAVAHGAAIYAGLLRNDKTISCHSMTVQNVNSHTLGVLGLDKAQRKRRQVMIAANTLLPATAEKRFSTHKEDQRSVTINVVEGGDDSGQFATAIGRCVIRDLPPNLPAGTAVDVAFSYEANGRLKVRATIPHIHKRASLDIVRESGMTTDELRAWAKRLGTNPPGDPVRKGDSDDVRKPVDEPRPRPENVVDRFPPPKAVVKAEEKKPSGDTDFPKKTVEDHPQRPAKTEAYRLPIEPGTQLREYRLVAKLAEGGMGTVFRAEHTQLGKAFALKVLAADRLGDERSIERFHREMKAVGTLEHPNIVRALNAGEEQGTHFLVMEFVQGVDLETLTTRVSPFPIAEACELIRQAALGLQHAHENGLIHRDLKPSNLMLTLAAIPGSRQKAGVVKILDFGLARLRGELLERRLSVAGQVLGTVDYMAPEQASGDETDIRADIYSLGCTLFRLLAGQPPFGSGSSGNVLKIMMAHAQRPIPALRTVRPDAPEGLEICLQRMLAKSPADRFQTPEALADALEPFAAGHDLPALADPSRPFVPRPRVEPVSPPPPRPTAPPVVPAKPRTDREVAQDLLAAGQARACLDKLLPLVDSSPTVELLKLAGQAAWQLGDAEQGLQYAMQLYGCDTASPADKIEACLSMARIYFLDESSREQASEVVREALHVDRWATVDLARNWLNADPTNPVCQAVAQACNEA